jgi:hypothetical protein
MEPETRELTPIKSRVSLALGRVSSPSVSLSFELKLTPESFEKESALGFGEKIPYEDIVFELSLKDESPSSITDLCRDLKASIEAKATLRDSFKVHETEKSVILTKINSGFALKLKALLKAFKPHHEVSHFYLRVSFVSSNEQFLNGNPEKESGLRLTENSKTIFEVNLPGNLAFDFVEVLKKNSTESIPPFKSEPVIRLFKGLEADLEFDNPSELFQSSKSLENFDGAFFGILTNIKEALTLLSEMKTEKTAEIKREIPFYLVQKGLGTVIGEISCPWIFE